MNPQHDRDFESNRFTQRMLPRLPISGPVAERTPRSVDVALVVLCAACALIAWWLP
jgi:hypothetical protein